MKLPFTHLSRSDIGSLERCVKSLPIGAVCVEIGSYLGASTVVIASNLPSGGKLYCIDTWMNDAMSEGPRDTFHEFLENTSMLSDKIVPVRLDSAYAARQLPDAIDFLFIDGDHCYDGCRADALAWLPKMKRGGIVALHDVGWAEGVRRVIREEIFPFQTGTPDIGANIYVAGIGERGSLRSAERPNVHSYVISNAPDPSAKVIRQITQAMGSRPWSWVSAGLDRRSCARSGSSQIEVCDAGAPGLVAGRHRALEACPADIIIYLDDDVSLPAGWMESILEPFADPDIHFVGCRYLPDYEHEPPSWLEGLWQERQDGFRLLGHLSLLDGGEATRPCPPTLVWGLCFAARRETLVKLGGFNPDGYPWELRRFRGDGEIGLTSKAEMLGLRACYQGKTHVKHRVPGLRMTFEYLERRSFLEGISSSFTEIRRDHQKPIGERRSLKDLARPAKWKIERELIRRRPSAEGARKLMARAHLAGTRFHRNEVRNDPKLLEWVLRRNYFNYHLPEGWANFIN
jgi:glucosyl-dolichyl phosphate glucuronosyltransferase